MGEKGTGLDIAQLIDNLGWFWIKESCSLVTRSVHLRLLGYFSIHLFSLTRRHLTFLVHIVSRRPCPSSARVLVRIPIGVEASQYHKFHYSIEGVAGTSYIGKVSLLHDLRYQRPFSNIAITCGQATWQVAIIPHRPHVPPLGMPMLAEPTFRYPRLTLLVMQTTDLYQPYHDSAGKVVDQCH